MSLFKVIKLDLREHSLELRYLNKFVVVLRSALRRQHGVNPTRLSAGAPSFECVLAPLNIGGCSTKFSGFTPC